jgi:hypothetical protein
MATELSLGYGRLPGGERLTWKIELVKNGAGKVMVKLYKNFELDGRAINDEDGEARARRAGLI